MPEDGAGTIRPGQATAPPGAPTGALKGGTGMELETDVQHREGHVEIALRGELDIAGSPGVRAALLGLVEAGHAHLVVDLSGLDLIDSTGISALVAARRSALGAGGGFCVRRASPVVRRVLAISGLVEHLNVSAD